MNNNVLSKTLVISVILLFIGVSCSSAISIYVKTNSDSNLRLKEDDTSLKESYEEIVISFYGIGKTKDIKLLLTEEQADKLEMIFNELDFKIRNSDSDSQTIDSINWAFDSFQEFNLFNKHDERIIKTLLISLIANSKGKHDTNPVKQGGNENFNCTISGYFETDLLRDSLRFYDGEHPIYESIWEFILNKPLIGFLLFPIAVFFLYEILHQFYGKEYDGYVTVGFHEIKIYYDYQESHYWEPAICDIQTDGTNGVVTWEGEQYGQIRKKKETRAGSGIVLVENLGLIRLSDNCEKGTPDLSS